MSCWMCTRDFIGKKSSKTAVEKLKSNTDCGYGSDHSIPWKFTQLLMCLQWQKSYRISSLEFESIYLHDFNSESWKQCAVDINSLASITLNLKGRILSWVPPFVADTQDTNLYVEYESKCANQSGVTAGQDTRQPIFCLGYLSIFAPNERRVDHR